MDLDADWNYRPVQLIKEIKNNVQNTSDQMGSVKENQIMRNFAILGHAVKPQIRWDQIKNVKNFN